MNGLVYVDFSGGLASAAALFRAIEKYGRGNVVARFADTLTESPDTYKFIDQVIEISGVELIRLSDGRDIWDVFMERKMLSDSRFGGCLASYWLKRVPLQRHAMKNHERTILIGYGPDECDRVERIKQAELKRQAKQGGEIKLVYDFPLRWNPKYWYCDVKSELEKQGVTTWPVAYDEGMGHNNCNRQCVQGGIGYWSLLWRDYPDRYLYNEGREQDFLAMLRSEGRKEYTILRDRRGGETSIMSLLDLRRQLERGERFVDENNRFRCHCDLATQMPLFEIAT